MRETLFVPPSQIGLKESNNQGKSTGQDSLQNLFFLSHQKKSPKNN